MRAKPRGPYGRPVLIDSSDLPAAQGALNRRAFVAAASTAAGALSLSAASAQDKKPSTHGPFWPNGARLAIALSMVVETGGDPAPTTKGPDGKAYPDLYAATAERYPANEGIPRMLDMLDRRKVKATTMICGQSCEKYPALAKDIAQRGHEIGAHGHQHDVQFNMEREAERAFMQKSRDTIASVTGQTPVGYNCRGQLRSPNTLSIAQELGFVYHIDDISRDEPFVMTVNNKPFGVVPYTSHLNDIGYFNNRGFAAPFAAELKYEFDALLAEAATRRRLMVVTMHDAIARASRIKAFEDFVAYAQSHKGVWFARGDELARWALGSTDSIKDPAAA